MTKHTEIPWTTDTLDWPLIINGPADEVIAIIDLPDDSKGDDEAGQRCVDNANHIAHAVNMHDKLCDALELVLKGDEGCLSAGIAVLEEARRAK